MFMLRLRESGEDQPATIHEEKRRRMAARGAYIGWQGEADCVPCGRLECAMLGMGRGARLACARGTEAKVRFFGN